MRDKLMTDMLDKLITAQGLLSSVYHAACDNRDSNIESLMSSADSCIVEAFDYINNIRKKKYE